MPLNFCIVSTTGALMDVGGNVFAGRQLIFRSITPQANQDNGLVDSDVVVTTDATGKFSVNLLQGASVALFCQPLGYNGTVFVVPTASTQDFATWVPAP